MDRHRKEVHKLTTNAHTCETCAKTFSTQDKLKDHVKSHNAPAYRCDKDPQSCDKVFKKMSALKAHINAIHLGLRPYVCKVEGCGSAFGYSSTLKNHMRVHDPNRESNVRSVICGKRKRPAPALSPIAQGELYFTTDVPAISGAATDDQAEPTSVVETTSVDDNDNNSPQPTQLSNTSSTLKRIKSSPAPQCSESCASSSSSSVSLSTTAYSSQPCLFEGCSSDSVQCDMVPVN